MIGLSSTPLSERFLQFCLPAPIQQNSDLFRLCEVLLIGKLSLERPTGNNIWSNLNSGCSKTTFYHQISALAWTYHDFYAQSVEKLLKLPMFALDATDTMIVDEHAQSCVSDNLEGSGIQYSGNKGETDLCRVLVSLHRFRPELDTPLDFLLYRPQEDLMKYNRQSQFKTKNELFQDIVKNWASKPGISKLWVFDCGYSSKDDLNCLITNHCDFVTRPRPNTKATFHYKHQSLAEIFDQIPDHEFQLTWVDNAKTRKKRLYSTATRDIFFKSVGTLRAVFVKNDRVREKDDVLEEQGEVIVSPTNRRFRVFITNRRDWSAKQILDAYTRRWPIEPFYRDLNQNLGSFGGFMTRIPQWLCLEAFSFLAAWFVQWLRLNHSLTEYGINLDTCGEIRQAFLKYCHLQWFYFVQTELKDCPPGLEEDWILSFIFGTKDRDNLLWKSNNHKK